MIFCGSIVVAIYQVPFTEKASISIVAEKPIVRPLIRGITGHNKARGGKTGEKNSRQSSISHVLKLFKKAAKVPCEFSAEKKDDIISISCCLPSPFMKTSKNPPVHIPTAVKNINNKTNFLFINIPNSLRQFMWTHIEMLL